MNRRSPFFVGMTGAAGVAVTYGIVELLIRARSALVLIGLGLFIAAGLNPVVSWLVRRGLPRWAAVLVVFTGMLGVIAIFVGTAIPPLTSQATALAHQIARGHLPPDGPQLAAATPAQRPCAQPLPDGPAGLASWNFYWPQRVAGCCYQDGGRGRKGGE